MIFTQGLHTCCNLPMSGLAWGLALLLAVTCQAASIKETTHRFGEETAPAYEIENRFFSLTVVPQRGGRITQWIDKADRNNLVWIGDTRTTYGGLLDDHENFAGLAYEGQIVEKSPQRIVVRLSAQRSDGVEYIKTLTVHEDKPLLQVDYQLSNPSQHPVRTLFRNVIRPGGGDAVSEDDIYCFPTTKGIEQTPRGFGRSGHTDDIGGPWMAFTSQSKRRAIATIFDGDAIRRFYAWRDSKTAPTYEYMFQQLEPGQRFSVTAYWQLTHGLPTLDHATRDVAMRVTPSHQDRSLNASVELVPTWEPLKKPSLTLRWLDPQRRPVGEAVTQSFDATAVGSVGKATFTGPAADANLPYVILEVTLQDGGQAITRMEKTLSFDPKGLTPDYTLKPDWHGHTQVQAIPGWEKYVAYTVTPDAQDQQAGYVVYEPFGPQAGRRAQRIELYMGVDEPETLPIHLQPLRDIGQVKVSIQRPADLPADALTIMAGEPAIHKDWGRTYVGWKLPVSDVLTPKANEESSVWIRLHTRNWKPGTHTLPVTFQPEQGQAQRVDVVVHVLPVWFPPRPSYTLYAHMLLNFLCAPGTPGKEPVYQRDWNFETGRRYMKDLQAHGNKVMSSYAQNALTGHGWQAILLRAKLRGSDQTLGQAIKDNPALFQSAELPDLDFSFWTPLFDESIAHGFTEYRTYLGGTGQVRQAFIQISRQVWQQPEMVENDPRHLRIHTWMYTQITRYLRDRGYRLLTAIIDDEIPHEKYAQWVSDALWARELGFNPGVTQSNTLLLSEPWLKQMGAGLDVSVIGAFNSDLLSQRLKEGRLKPLKLETYESSANYWKNYDEERSFVGFFGGSLPIDACWIQCYYRWNQAEAIIFPSEAGPISTAAWEGVRDGMDDANYYRMAKGLVERSLAHDRAKGSAAEAKLRAIVSQDKDALISLGTTQNRMGTISTLRKRATPADMRQAKRLLLELIVEVRDALPASRLSLSYDTFTLSDQGRPTFTLQGSEQARQALLAGLRTLDGSFAFAPTSQPNRVVLTTRDQLSQAGGDPLPASMTRDLSQGYPEAGNYVIRSHTDAQGRWVIALIGGDQPGLDKAIHHWTQFIEHSLSDGRPASSPSH